MLSSCSQRDFRRLSTAQRRIPPPKNADPPSLYWYGHTQELFHHIMVLWVGWDHCMMRACSSEKHWHAQDTPDCTRVQIQANESLINGYLYNFTAREWGLFQHKVTPTVTTTKGREGSTCTPQEHKPTSLCNAGKLQKSHEMKLSPTLHLI